MQIAIASLLTTLAATPIPAAAGDDAGASADDVNFVVLRENGTGSAAQAQPFVAEMLGVMYGLAGWGDEAKFSYETTRKKAKAYIDAEKPEFGIMTFGAFLGLHKAYGYDAIGEADAAGSGGGHYYMISREASDLAGCKGKTLASNHFDDDKFIDKVVSGGAFTLAEFEVVKTRRPVQTLKKVTRDEAVCALIDHAQFEALQKLDGHEGVHTVWFSRDFSSYVVVAFKDASDKQKKTLRNNLDKVCTGDGKKSCERAGVTKLAKVGDGEFKDLLQDYGG